MSPNPLANSESKVEAIRLQCQIKVPKFSKKKEKEKVKPRLSDPSINSLQERLYGHFGIQDSEYNRFDLNTLQPINDCFDPLADKLKDLESEANEIEKLKSITGRAKDQVQTAKTNGTFPKKKPKKKGKKKIKKVEQVKEDPDTFFTGAGMINYEEEVISINK